MKKTVNINLGGILFHMDEDAYIKLSDYLNAIRASLQNTEGHEEILHDIEIRLAELFSEKLPSPQHVIGMKEVNEAILVMGQPEDYAEGTEDFGNEQKSDEHARADSDFRNYRRLYRDEDDKWVGGVSSGLAHYFGIDPLWVRLIWVLLLIAGVGSPILIYLLLWAFVPAAVTTADKLRMHGEPINISNIEKKFREGYENVASKVKGVDYDKYGNKIKTGTSRFFDTLGDIIVTLLKIVGKLLGALLILIGFSVIVGLIFSLIGISSFGYFSAPDYYDYFSFTDSVLPLWAIGIFVLFAVGIPFFALFILGLKLIVPNLRPVNKVVSTSLWLLWLLAIIGLIYVGVQQSQMRAYNGNVVEERVFTIPKTDTLYITMKGNSYYGIDLSKKSGLESRLDEQDKQVLFSTDIRLHLRPASDSVGKIIVEKSARGKDFILAKKRADAISYDFDISGRNIALNSYFTTDKMEGNKEQQVSVSLFIPENTIVYPQESIRSYLQSSVIQKSEVTQFHLFKNKTTECLSCPVADTLATPQQSSPKENWEDEVLKHF